MKIAKIVVFTLVFAILGILSTVGIVFAYIDLLTPIEKMAVGGESVYLGAMGPGQTMAVSFEPQVTEGGKFGEGGYWDYIEVKDVPAGWRASDSKLYADPLQIEITAAKDAAEGNYTAVVNIVDENNADRLGDMLLYLTIQIKYDIFDLEVSPLTKTTGAYQPARFIITIKNKGSVQDKFKISSSGMRGWDFTKSIYVPAQSEKEIDYEVVGGEEEKYDITITATSESSEIIKKSKGVNMDVNTNLISDYKAVNNGLLIFPIIESPIYSLMGLISNLF